MIAEMLVMIPNDRVEKDHDGELGEKLAERTSLSICPI